MSHTVSEIKQRPRAVTSPKARTSRKSLILAGVIGIVLSLILTSGLVRVLEAEFDFSEAARLTFLPVRVLLVAAVALYVAVPLHRILRKRL